MKKNERIGEQKIMNCGYKATIIQYNNAKDVLVKFNDFDEVVKTSYETFNKKNVKSNMTPTVFNLGYFGVGEYTLSREDKYSNIRYKYWYNMLKRCYSKEDLIKQPTYEDKLVCEDWLNYQNFAKWFDENYYECNDEKMQLDKDILKKGNILYSPDTCVFVPQRINLLFVKRQNCRGEYPIGVEALKDKFRAKCHIYENSKSIGKHLGVFNTPVEAFLKYKEYKEKYIKDVAEEYKDIIPKELYSAMNKYIVEIDD